MAREPGPMNGPEAHAEAAWHRLHTPGTTPAERADAADAFAAACRAIEAHGPSAVAELERLAASREPAALARAAAAARVLAEVGTTEAAAALVRIALAPDITIAGRALGVLPSMRLSQAAQSLLIDAVRHPPVGAEAHRHGLLAPGLARQLVTGDDFEATLWARTHPSATVRAAWARALARAGGRVAAAQLPAMAEDPDVLVRLWAAFGRVLEGDGAALALLAQALRSARSDERAAAVGLLGVLPLPAAAPPVLAATADRSPVVACVALVRAAHTGVRAALPALARQLDHARADVVEHAAWALRELLGEDPGYAWCGRRLTPASVAGVRARCRAIHDGWAPDTRYCRGDRMTAQIVSRSLDEPSGAGAEAAHFTLLGMSGCTFGFDPAADLVANRAPVGKHQAWAREHGPLLLPGAHYHRGEVVPPG